MIRFFRKIRQDLLSNGNNGKYLKYAIGEILLVMVGILLALSVNNWNESNKQENIIQNVLAEIKDDLIQDKAQLEISLKAQEKDLAAQHRVIKAWEARVPFNDSIRADLGHIFLARTFYSVSKGYNLLKEMNVSSLIDKELRIALTKYYEVDIPGVYREFEDDKMGFEDYFLPQARKYFREWNFGGYGEPHDYQELLDDKYFLAATKMNCFNLQGTITALTAALESADKLIKQLPEE